MIFRVSSVFQSLRNFTDTARAGSRRGWRWPESLSASGGSWAREASSEIQDTECAERVGRAPLLCGRIWRAPFLGKSSRHQNKSSSPPSSQHCPQQATGPRSERRAVEVKLGSGDAVHAPSMQALSSTYTRTSFSAHHPSSDNARNRDSRPDACLIAAKKRSRLQQEPAVKRAQFVCMARTQ